MSKIHYTFNRFINQSLLLFSLNRSPIYSTHTPSTILDAIRNPGLVDVVHRDRGDLELPAGQLAAAAGTVRWRGSETPLQVKYATRKLRSW